MTYSNKNIGFYRIFLSIFIGGAIFMVPIAVLIYKQEQQHLILMVIASLLFFIIFSYFTYLWGIRPIQKKKRELQCIQGAKKQFLVLPNTEALELASIYHSTNRALFQAKDNENKYRKTLDDLAHSLKNHIIASKLLLQELPLESTQKLTQQLTLMDGVIQGQLQRATSGITNLTKTTTIVNDPLKGLLPMFRKIYNEKNIDVYCLFDAEQTLPIQKNDLMEILGNTLENSFRFASSQITITIEMYMKNYILSIENDGPTIPEEQKKELFLRGVRADKINSGTGLGLALCADIIERYKGDIWFDTPKNKHIGALLKIKLPN